MASSSSCINTDWSNCFICQNGTSEKLITPRCGYKTLSNNIPIFQSISALPLYLNPQRLDDGSGIEQTLIDNNAKYHDSCRLLFKDSKLAKAQKRYDNQKRKANFSLSKMMTVRGLKEKHLIWMVLCVLFVINMTIEIFVKLKV